MIILKSDISGVKVQLFGSLPYLYPWFLRRFGKHASYVSDTRLGELNVGDKYKFHSSYILHVE